MARCFSVLLPLHPAAGCASAASRCSGQIVVDGHATPYLIRHLPVSSFPATPACRPGSAHPPRLPDSADLRGAPAGKRRPRQPGAPRLLRLGRALLRQGTVSLLVFFASASTRTHGAGLAPETERLQAHGQRRLASTGASIPHRPSRSTRRRSACASAAAPRPRCPGRFGRRPPHRLSLLFTRGQWTLRGHARRLGRCRIKPQLDRRGRTASH